MYSVLVTVYLYVHILSTNNRTETRCVFIVTKTCNKKCFLIHFNYFLLSVVMLDVNDLIVVG